MSEQKQLSTNSTSPTPETKRIPKKKVKGAERERKINSLTHVEQYQLARVYEKEHTYLNERCMTYAEAVVYLEGKVGFHITEHNVKTAAEMTGKDWKRRVNRPVNPRSRYDSGRRNNSEFRASLMHAMREALVRMAKGLGMDVPENLLQPIYIGQYVYIHGQAEPVPLKRYKAEHPEDAHAQSLSSGRPDKDEPATPSQPIKLDNGKLEVIPVERTLDGKFRCKG